MVQMDNSGILKIYIKKNEFKIKMFPDISDKNKSLLLYLEYVYMNDKLSNTLLHQHTQNRIC